uniref:CxC3 like cysteine cluster domain-containing protein n=2 Tax=Clytia hemisphaerica TaxID=252671 RepID=A0A7M5WXJ8_9CNID
EPTEISPEIILNLELLLKHKKKKKRKNKSWSQRRNAVEEKWEEHREDILSAVILNNSFDGLCQYCKFEKIAVKCDTCFWKKLCIKCDEKLHVEYPMHNRIGIFDGFKRTLSPSETVDEESVIIDKYPTIPLMPINCQSCDSYNVERIPGDCVAVVTIAGKYYLHLYSLRCKDCDSTSNPFTLENVVGSGFWPSAPTKFSYLFHVETLQFWDTLRKNAPGTSEAAFLEVLNTMTNLHGRKTGKITPAIFSMAFKEWCFCQHKIHILQKKKWIECPSCTHVQHSCHVDGNCKLYRYRSSG